MTGNLVSDNVFLWFVTLMTGVVAGTWFFYDLYSLSRLKSRGDDDAVAHDKRFGYVMGMVIGAAGVYGCLLAHGVV
jgi:hypothetical protein